ncbi:MAG: hypothetical protein C6I01_03270 [Epsilonproteobacteria bacterium]|nr:hypothetical protein [Campylobacterota bacterium]
METFPKGVVDMWWIWVIIGLLFVGLEVIVPGVTLVWFGLGAILVGIVNYFFPLNLVINLFLWATFSVIFIVLTFKYMKKGVKGEKIDVNRHLYEGKKGVITEVLDHFFAKAEFEEPILGDRVWKVKGENLQVGDIVEVEGVEGNYFRVRKVAKEKGN